MRNAIIVAVGTGNRYQLRYNATRATVWAINAQSVPLKVGLEVLVQIDLSGASSGKQPRIVGVAQSSDNGAIAVERVDSAARVAGTITRWPAPLPIVLVAGGLSERRTLYGTNLAVAPSSYGHASIVDGAAAAVGGTSITIDVKALVACPKGRYAMTLDGETVVDFFEVV